MKIIVRRKVTGVVLIMLFAFFTVISATFLDVYAMTCEESGVITDYNTDYYDSYDEFIGDDSAHFLIDENDSIYETSSVDIVTDELSIIVCDTVEDAGKYVRKCMVNRADRIEFIFKNQEGYTGKEGFSAIKAATFVETDNPKEGDYLYWNYAGLEGSFDIVDEGIKYTLNPSYLSTVEQEMEIDEKVLGLISNEFAGWEAMDEFDRIKLVYTWVTKNLTFVGGSENHSTYSGIIQHETVCQGFASTIYRLLREMDVSCRVISNDDHGWNIVKIGECYYNIDSTWDAGETEASWDNFLLSNATFEKGYMHIRGERFDTEVFNQLYPMATSDYIWTPNAATISVEYRTHVQTKGWQDWVADGARGGTEGQSKRLEAISIHMIKQNELDLNVEYMTHIQSIGWEPDWKASDSVSGTVGKGKRLEAIKIRLTGSDSDRYDIFYRVHAQTFGWLGWAKNGEIAGTTGMSKRLEGIQIVVLPKGKMPDGFVGYSYVAYGKTALEDDCQLSQISYSSHVQSYGWQKQVADGSVSGTFGEGKRLEGIKISLNNMNYDGGVQYRSHIQSYGWEKDWMVDGDISGTNGQSKRLEAIQIKLYGEVSDYYDVYYRVHVQSLGWLGWVKNGETAGTEGQAKRMEAIQILLVPKALEVPVNLD